MGYKFVYAISNGVESGLAICRVKVQYIGKIELGNYVIERRECEEIIVARQDAVLYRPEFMLLIRERKPEEKYLYLLKNTLTQVTIDIFSSKDSDSTTSDIKSNISHWLPAAAAPQLRSIGLLPVLHRLTQAMLCLITSDCL